MTVASGSTEMDVAVPTAPDVTEPDRGPGRIAISAVGLSKQYRIGLRQNKRTLREAIMENVFSPWRRLRRLVTPGHGSATMWALRDVSFDVRGGDVVGIIGRNGAGKSTLLKILSRITEPTSGKALIYGRVGSLLEVGTGFHSELTGRENIFLNGAILGMRRAQIQARFDEIVAFAEVSEFIDTPVKHYSSGMYLRLAFAVAAHMEPEILLVDEVLAVGDAQFQKKCLGKMHDVATEGRTVLFVSHNLAAVRSLCNRGILLNEGSVLFAGSIERVVYRYNQLLTEPGTEVAGGEGSLSEVSLNDVRINGSLETTIRPGDDFQASCRVYFRSSVPSFRIFCIIQDGNGDEVVVAGSNGGELKLGNPGFHSVSIRCPGLWLRPGVYSLYFKLFADSVTTSNGRFRSDTVMLDIDDPNHTGPVLGLLAPRVTWRLES